MKTAVEWLEDNLIFEPWAEDHFKHNSECWDKAKEMEKEQIIYSNYNGQSVGKKLKDINIHQMKNKAEQYYNETFKSE
jgi:hypothetical protein